MKKYLLIFPLFFIVSCSNKQMNDVSFSEVMMGMSEKELVEAAGKPYNICKHKNGVLEYEYIERFEGAKRKIMQINYYITVKNGTVTHKRMERSYPPGYMYDSLDYQSKRD